MKKSFVISVIAIVFWFVIPIVLLVRTAQYYSVNSFWFWVAVVSAVGVEVFFTLPALYRSVRLYRQMKSTEMCTFTFNLNTRSVDIKRPNGK